VLASYVINERPTPPFPPEQPIVIAIIELDEGTRMMSNIVGVEPVPENLPLGAPAHVDLEERGQQVLPVFRLIGRSQSPACTMARSSSSVPPRPIRLESTWAVIGIIAGSA
jgi:hypothetical protein